MSGHLGEVAAQLVDGQLGHDARDRALAHLMRCAACRDEVDAQRALKARLTHLGAPPAEPGLAGRLVALGSGPTFGAPVPAPLREPPSHHARHPQRPGGRPSRGAQPSGGTLRFAVAGAASLTLVGLTTAVVTAGPDADGRQVRPAVARFVVDHAGTTGEVPLTNPAVGAAVSVSYTP